MDSQPDPAAADDFASLFAFLPIGAYRSTPDGRQLRANPALVKLNGYSSEAQMLQAVRDIGRDWYVQPGRRDEFRRHLQAHGQVVAFESEIWRHHSRERIWVSENAHAVFAADGRALYYEGTVEDITERVLAREALRASREELRQIVDVVPGMVYRTEILPNGGRRATFASRGARTLLGVEPEALLADGQLLPRLRHPDDDARVSAEIEHAIAHAAPWHSEFRVVLADGRVKWLQANSDVAPGDGPVQVRVGVFYDISAKKHAEQALLDNSRLWKRALESAGDGVWDCNVQSGVETFSPQLAALYGWPRQELTATVDTFDALTHPDDRAAMLRAREAHFSGRTPAYVNEHRLRCQDGQWKWVLSRGIVIDRDAGGRPLRMIGTHTDITADKQAQALRAERDRAAAADLAKSQFLSRVSHELRTPLNAILGFAQLLELDPGEGGAGNTRQRGWLRQVLVSGRHLLALMDDILELSSAQTGQLPMACEALPLPPVVDEVLAMLAGLAQQAGVALQVAWPADSARLTVLADRKRLKQIVSNLLSNAVKYNHRGGSVRLTAGNSSNGSDGTTIDISVSDTGPGLDESQLARLFQPFERVGAQRGTVAGTGLGLALSRQFAEAMGGSITVTSQPGHGSTFVLRLPRGDDGQA